MTDQGQPKVQGRRADRLASRTRAAGARTTSEAATRAFVTAVPGLAPSVAEQLARLGIRAQHQGFDGRSDVVLVDVDRRTPGAALALALAEDAFVEVGRTGRAEGDNPSWIAGRLWKPVRVERALSYWANHVRPLSGAMTFRVVARVLQERSFLRTDLRREMTRAIGRQRPRWRTGDPADLEVWVMEYQPGRFVAGLRLSGRAMRQHDGRSVERHGALRPTVAAAMVDLAGRPGGLLLDPCCGSGTILAEAHAAGWAVRGIDIDGDALAAAAANVPSAQVGMGDARDIDAADASIGACVSNLPFGQQFQVEGDMQSWLAAVLRELQRVTTTGGRVVLLAPELPRTAVPGGLGLVHRYPLRLLGTKTSIWV